MMRKMALLLAAALFMAALINAGIGAGTTAHAAPGDIITLDPHFLQDLVEDNHLDTNSDGQISQGEMAAAVSLTIDNADIESIAGIEFATGLHTLTIAGTKITSIPSGISALTALTSLEIKNNALIGTANLSGLWSLTGLTSLTLYDIGLTSLPAGIGNLTNLTELNIQSNRLTSLPAEIGSLTQLQTINIWGNRLTSISSSMFGGMANLASLDIVGNYLNPLAGSDDRTQVDAIAAAHPSAYIVYAIQEKCPVTLNFDGGTGTALAASYYYGQSVTLPAATKTGYTFTGWDTDGDGIKDRNAGGSVQIAPSPVTANTVFKAIYCYTVTFRTQTFGTIGGGTADIVVEVNPGGTVSSVPTIAANSGYTSLGWYDGDTAMTEGQILALAILGNKTFMAKYEAVGTIHFTDAGFQAALVAATEDADGFITEAEMAALESLTLSGGGFTNLAGIEYATNLKTLHMNNCGLTLLPANISNITTLTALDLSNNKFNSIPVGIASLTNLTDLNLSGNLLTTVPANFFSPFTSLASLNLQSNYLNPSATYDGLPVFADYDIQKTYAITLNFNGGAGTALPKTGYYYGELIPLPLASKASYEFVGWDTDGDGHADTAGAGTVTFTPDPPDSAASKTYKAVYHSSDATLSGIGFAGGTISPAFSPAVTNYTITLYDYVGSVTLTPRKSHAAATMKINNSAVASLPVSIASPAASSVVTVALTAEDGVTTRAYTLTVRRAAAVSLNLARISYPLGVTWNPVFSPGVTSYVALVPASMGSATLGVTRSDAAATVKIAGVAGASRAISVGQGMAVAVPIVVSSPGTTDRTRTYTVTLKRGTTLSGFSAVPKAGSAYTLSPGGTNRMTFRYTMNGPGAVKIEVYKSKRWVQILSRAEASAGAKTWAWDGKVSGKYLAVATYKVRITPSAYSVAGPSATISVKIVKSPSVSWSSVATKFRATGAVRTLCKFKTNCPTNAVVRVYNARGKIVAVVKSVTNMAPNAYNTVTWDGRATSGNTAGLKIGALAPTGSYTIRVAVGTKTYTKSIKITR